MHVVHLGVVFFSHPVSVSVSAFLLSVVGYPCVKGMIRPPRSAGVLALSDWVLVREFDRGYGRKIRRNLAQRAVYNTGTSMALW